MSYYGFKGWLTLVLSCSGKNLILTGSQSSKFFEMFCERTFRGGEDGIWSLLYSFVKQWVSKKLKIFQVFSRILKPTDNEFASHTCLQGLLLVDSSVSRHHIPVWKPLLFNYSCGFLWLASPEGLKRSPPDLAASRFLLGCRGSLGRWAWQIRLWKYSENCLLLYLYLRWQNCCQLQQQSSSGSRLYPLQSCEDLEVGRWALSL